VPLGALGRDQQMPGPLEFVIELLMPNDLDLLELEQAPIGALTLGDGGRGDGASLASDQRGRARSSLALMQLDVR
jgi:hypothetical protein